MVRRAAHPNFLSGPWPVSFRGSGAPGSEPALKYFSGTATYTQSFIASPSWLRSGAHLVLDLSSVGDITQVSIDGTAAERRGRRR